MKNKKKEKENGKRQLLLVVEKKTVDKKEREKWLEESVGCKKAEWVGKLNSQQEKMVVKKAIGWVKLG